MGVSKGKPKAVAGNSLPLEGSIINFTISGKGRVIPLLFSPSSLSDSLSASFTQTTIPGGSAPQVTYTSTGARQVTLSVTVPIDYLPPNSSYNNTEEYLNAFRALVYPSYDGTGSVNSPHCALSLPNLYIDGYCSSCSIDYKVDRYGTNGALASDVNLTFIEVMGSAISASTIAGKVTVLGNNGNYSTNSSTNSYYSSRTTIDTSTKYQTTHDTETEGTSTVGSSNNVSSITMTFPQGTSTQETVNIDKNKPTVSPSGYSYVVGYIMNKSYTTKTDANLKGMEAFATVNNAISQSTLKSAAYTYFEKGSTSGKIGGYTISSSVGLEYYRCDINKFGWVVGIYVPYNVSTNTFVYDKAQAILYMTS